MTWPDNLGFNVSNAVICVAREKFLTTVKVKGEWAREHVYFSDVEITSKIWLPMSTWRYVGPSDFIRLGKTRSFSGRNDRYSHSEYEWLIHALVWSEHGTQLLWFRLAFVWCRQQRWRLPRPYCMAHASDATRATLQHCVHICYTSRNCRIHTTRSSLHVLTSRDTNARIKLTF